MSSPAAESGVAFDTDGETQLILESLDQFIEREVEPLEAEYDDVLAVRTPGRATHVRR